MLKEGQTWFFDGDNLTVKSYLVVRKIEVNEERSAQVVHVSIKDIRIDGELWDIAHLPLDYKVLVKSLKAQNDISCDQCIVQEFEEAYALWKADNGGVWSIELKDVIRDTLINAGLLQK
ncbi:MAG: hypothetical protein U0V64_16480 [Cyclobacteriaceae bacterium]